MSNEAAVDFVSSRLEREKGKYLPVSSEQHGAGLSGLAEELANHAVALGSPDNVTVTLVTLP